MPRHFLRATVAFLVVGGALAGPRTTLAQGPGQLKVVTSLSTYAAIAREIVGDRGEVISIGRGDENPHFVQPRPSFALQLQRADLFVVTGLDLELWVPALMDRANNPKVREGGPGHVTAYTGVELLDIPAAVSRSGGDIHAFGNPHIWADPINGIIIGQNILIGLSRVSPENASYFQERYGAWMERVLSALAGSELVELLGPEAVLDLAKQRRLWDFVHEQVYQGHPLADRLGGWLAQSRAFRRREMVCYHKEWDYFTSRFGIPCVDFVEPKPGIPPTPGHVAALMRLIREQQIPALLAANFYDQRQVRTIASRTGATAVIVPANAEGAPGTDTYIGLVSMWVRELAAAFNNANR
jgi:zinc/manganese transport system substrate-binding protein